MTGIAYFAQGLVFIVVMCVLPWSVKGDCSLINSCSCEDTSGAGKIDLSPLDGGSSPRQVRVIRYFK